MNRLATITGLPADVGRPAYERDAYGEGIVHLGLGAFHKAHQAVYTDDALSVEGGCWRIVAVSLRSSDAVKELRPQNGLFTVIEAGADGMSARVVGAISRALAHAHGDAKAVRAALATPDTRIVTITVTEKGYGIDRGTGGVDTAHPAIAHDLGHADAPIGVAGLLVQALGVRRAAGTPPFTILSCDNLPGNGGLVRGLVLDFAVRTNPDLRDWIAEHVAFPSSMVDRITPVPDEGVRETARQLTGRDDYAAILTEAFRQWVIEDCFLTGRPAWETAGALLVEDVAPYEHMKLRMLNGSHSMLAYAGFLTGRSYVRDVMQDPDLASLVRRHLRAAAETLKPLQGIDFDEYATQLAARFENPNLAHETYQIAMDGTEKMPQRIFAPALDALLHNQDVRPYAFATAVWMRYCLGVTDNGKKYALRDPREDEIAASCASGKGEATNVAAALFELPRLLPPELANARSFRRPTVELLGEMMKNGTSAVVRREVGL